jgi:DNA-binding Xre family transcriptional regulator
MEIKQIVIKKVDLKKLLRNKNLSLGQLSRLSGIDKSFLSKCSNGYMQMNEKSWERLKFFL